MEPHGSVDRLKQLNNTATPNTELLLEQKQLFYSMGAKSLHPRDAYNTFILLEDLLLAAQRNTWDACTIQTIGRFDHAPQRIYPLQPIESAGLPVAFNMPAHAHPNRAEFVRLFGTLRYNANAQQLRIDVGTWENLRTLGHALQRERELYTINYFD